MIQHYRIQKDFLVRKPVEIKIYNVANTFSNKLNFSSNLSANKVYFINILYIVTARNNTVTSNLSKN